MYLKRLCRSLGRHSKSEQGFSLIEVTVGIAVLSLVIVTFLPALGTSIGLAHQANVRTTVESLADGQMEKIKAGSYYVSQNGTADYSPTIGTVPTGYRFSTLDTSGATVNGTIYGISWDVAADTRWTQGIPADPGIQKITIIVESNSQPGSKGTYREVFRLTDFKVNR